MKDKKRNPLVLLICIIVLLVFTIIILLMTSMPLMTTARENAFRIEANNVVKGAETALSEYNNDKLVINENNENVCINEEKICMTIDYLSDNSYYKNNNYRGKIEINIKDINNPMFTLYLTRSAEFRFVGLSYTNYTDYGQVNNDVWLDEYETCTCETTE